MNPLMLLGFAAAIAASSESGRASMKNMLRVGLKAGVKAGLKAKDQILEIADELKEYRDDVLAEVQNEHREMSKKSS